MKKYIPYTRWLVALVLPMFLTSFIPTLTAQSFSAQAGSMKLSGTSTMHDWTMNGPFSISGKFSPGDGTQALKTLDALRFSLVVEQLKSDKKKLDETAYKALKTNDHKEITFIMTSAKITPVHNRKYAITALGNLTIAGVTKPITMMVDWIVHDDMSVTCTGTQKLKMTDYEVKPPGFLGIMKAGDEISLDFSFHFKS